MKIQFTEQYKPKASLSDKQAVSEEFSEHFLQKYGLYVKRILKVYNETLKDGPVFIIECNCQRSDLNMKLYRLTDGKISHWDVTALMHAHEAGEFGSYELAYVLNNELRLFEYGIKLSE